MDGEFVKISPSQQCLAFFDLPTEGVQDTNTRKVKAAQKRVAIVWWLWDMRNRCGHKNLEPETLCKHEGGYDLCGSHTKMSRTENGCHTDIPSANVLQSL